VAPPPVQQDAQKPLGGQEAAEPILSEAPSGSPVPPNHVFVSKEEKVEYRDQDGKLLDPEMVKSLEGKVSFKTKYETRTRMLDAAGNVIGESEDAGVAPPHPDVDNVDPETIAVENAAQDSPASQVDVSADESKEESAENVKTGEAKPASEGNDATA
jgi:dolichyl-phosphate-mannose-protein mannosyltransferase